jgi:peptidoglycan/xylan/chitin deacetylase (PgdA/CDA1 family)
MDLNVRPPHAVRTVPSDCHFLTFDDGPDPFSTSKVLQVLNQEKVKATFFVVAEKAMREKALLREIVAEGHAIGNHSLDHGYRNFFRPASELSDWVKKSENQISSLIGMPTVGFRPPAGVRTPKLHEVLQQQNLPLVLWNRRFFDTVFPWSPGMAHFALKFACPGSILLLHDRQSSQKLPLFNQALTAYIKGARKNQIDFDKLSLELCRRASTE